MSDSEAEISLETQFEPRDDDDETLWEVLEIIAERKNMYRVRWAGTDPKTRKPWAPSWVPKHDCTDDLVKIWKKKKLKEKNEKEAAKTKKTTAKKVKEKPPGVKGKGKAREQSLEIPILSEGPEIVPTRPSRSRSKNTAEQQKDTANISGPSHTHSSSSHSTPMTKIGPPRHQKRKRLSAVLEDEPPSARDREQQLQDSVKLGPTHRAKKLRVESSVGTANVPSARGHTAGYVGNRSDSPGLVQKVDRRERRSEESEGQHSEKSGDRKRTKAQVRNGTEGSDEDEEGDARRRKKRRRLKSEDAYKEEEEEVNAQSRDRKKEQRTGPNATGSEHEEEDGGDDVRIKSRAKQTETKVRDTSVRSDEHEPGQPLQLSPRELDLSPEPESSFWEEPFGGMDVPQDDLHEGINSKDEVIPETQPSHRQDDSQVEGILAHHTSDDSHEQQGSENEQNIIRRASTPTRSPQQLPVPLTKPRSPLVKAHVNNTGPKSKTSSKPLRPVPVVSPSAFRPFLPRAPAPWSQDTIEEFSSPERPFRPPAPRAVAGKVRKSPFHDRSSASVQNGKREFVLPNYNSHSSERSPEQDPEAVVQSMEADYIDMTGGHVTDDIQTSGHTHEKSHSDKRDRSNLNGQSNTTLVHNTQSTQQAVVDSQSQISIVQNLDSPRQQNTQVTELRAQLQSNNDALALVQNDLRARDEELAEVKARLAARDGTLAEHKHQLRVHEETVAVLESQVKHHEAQEAKLRAEAERIALEEEELKQQIERYQSQNEELCIHKEALKRDTEQLSEEILVLKRRCDVLSKVHPDAAAISDEQSDEGYSDGGSSSVDPPPTTASLLADKLFVSEARVTELEAIVQQLRTDGVVALRQTYDGQVRKLESEVAQWRGLCGILQKKDERTDDEVRRRAGEEPELRKRLVELEAKYTELEKDANKAEEERVRLLTEKEKWVDEKEEWVDEVKELTLAVEQLEQEREDWRAKDLEMQDALAARADEKMLWDESKIALKGKIKKLDAELSESRAQNTNFQRQLSKLETEKAHVESQSEDKSVEISVLMAAKEKLREELEASRTGDSTLRSNWLALQEEHNALRGEETTLKARLESFQEESASFRRSLDESLAERDRMAQQHQAEVEAFTSSLSQSKAELENLREKSVELAVTKTKLSNENAMLRAEADGLSALFSSLQEKYVLLEEEHADLQQAAEAMTTDIDHTKKENDDLQAQWERFATEREKLQSCMRLVEAFKATLAESLKTPSISGRALEEDAWFVCFLVEEEGEECRKRFKSRTDLRSHVWKDHFAD